MLFFKFTAIWCLLVCGSVVGFKIKFEEALSNVNDVTKYDVNYDDVVDVSWRYNDHYYETSQDKEDSPSSDDDQIDDDAFDSWSVVWYIASFGGLIGFFLVVSCSEWCCRKHIRERHTRRTAVSPSIPASPTSESPPPAYDLFAPPSYESLGASPNNEKNEYDIYVVPVHAISSLVETDHSRQENPPSYSSINVEREDRTTSPST